MLLNEFTGNTFIDFSVLKIVDYFSMQMHSYLIVAIQLGVFFSALGIIWQCIQMVFGTLEQRKFLVGTITKWFLFLFCLTFYPAVSKGLCTFATQMATYVSGAKINEITNDFGEYLEILEKSLKADKDELDEVIRNLQKAQENTSYTNLYQATSNNMGYGGLVSRYDMITEQLYSAQAKQKEIESIIESIGTDNPKGVAKTINALREILIIDNTDVSKKYSLNIGMKDAGGNNTGFLSPNGMLRVSILSAQIMWQKVWEDDVMKEWNENAKKGWVKERQIIDFPFSKIFDIILCFACEILEVVITCIELIQYVMCICEFVICVTFGIVLIPCLLFDGLKDMAQKLLPFLLSQTVKLAMITICMFFCCYTYIDIAKRTIADTSSFNLWSFCYVVFTILLTFSLCSNAPKLASALLTGQPQMSMGEFVQSAAAIAGGATLAHKAVGAGKAAVGTSARFTANRLGDVAAMAGGAAGGASRAAGHADSKVGKGVLGTAGAIGGALGALGSRTGNRIARDAQTAAATWGKKGAAGAGGMGGGSNAENRFGMVNHGKGVENGSESINHAMDYAGHQNENGKQSTLVGYMRDTFQDYARLKTKEKPQDEKGIVPVHPDSPDNNGGNNYNPPAAFGGGSVAPSPTPRPPMGGGGSSVSYSPPALPDYSDEGLSKLKSANID